MEDDGLVKRFGRAAEHGRKLAASLSQEQMLVLYGLYKQATVGSNNTSKPSFVKVTERRKWEAWTAHRDKSKVKAMEEYVSAVELYDPEFSSRKDPDPSEATENWVHVSSLAVCEPDLSESEKTMFDWVKENDEKRVEECLGAGFDLEAADDNGMTVMHWAADRGHLFIVKRLLEAGVNPNCRDSEGQTPLHYAASCGHADVARVLLKAGADATAVDEDGCTPPDLDLLLVES